jgi:hypothetical protein
MPDFGNTNWVPLFSRAQPGGFFVAQNMPEHPGNVWFVGNAATYAADSPSAGITPLVPFSTLDYAISDSRVGTGDTFYILPGHAENLAIDSAVDVDVVNLHICGLGWGGNRPTFTCTAVAGDFKLAASCGILENILFINAINNSTGLLEVGGSDWEIRNIEIREGTAIYADQYVTIIAGADRCHFHHNIIQGLAANGSVSAVTVNDADYLHMHDNYIYGNYDTGVVQFITAPSAQARIHDETYWQLDDTAGAGGVQFILDTITTSTGIIGPDLNLVGIVDAANITEAITGATFNVVGPIWVNNKVAEQSMQINWTASGD